MSLVLKTKQKNSSILHLLLPLMSKLLRTVVHYTSLSVASPVTVPKSGFHCSAETVGQGCQARPECGI